MVGDGQDAGAGRKEREGGGEEEDAGGCGRIRRVRIEARCKVEGGVSYSEWKTWRERERVPFNPLYRKVFVLIAITDHTTEGGGGVG